MGAGCSRHTGAAPSAGFKVRSWVWRQGRQPEPSRPVPTRHARPSSSSARLPALRRSFLLAGPGAGLPGSQHLPRRRHFGAAAGLSAPPGAKLPGTVLPPALRGTAARLGDVAALPRPVPSCRPVGRDRGSCARHGAAGRRQHRLCLRVLCASSSPAAGSPRCSPSHSVVPGHGCVAAPASVPVPEAGTVLAACRPVAARPSRAHSSCCDLPRCAGGCGQAGSAGTVVAAHPCEGSSPNHSTPVLSACPSRGHGGSSGSGTVRQHRGTALPGTAGHRLPSAGYIPRCRAGRTAAVPPGRDKREGAAASLPATAPSWRLWAPGPPCRGCCWWRATQGVGQDGAGAFAVGQDGWDGGVEGEPKPCHASLLHG